jgi:hypothetical protein
MNLYVLCIDVGSKKKIGWHDSNGHSGGWASLEKTLLEIGERLNSGHPVAIGFEAPIWTPTRNSLDDFLKSRYGIEKEANRAWSASAGANVLAASLALMPFCFTKISETSPKASTTVNLAKFHSTGGLFIWEAFVSGKSKQGNGSDINDARIACEAFVIRWPNIVSDIPAEPAINHAVVAAYAAKLDIELTELFFPSIVVSG